MLRFVTLIGVLCLAGCNAFPEIGFQPEYHNPFPQLSKVAVAPFFNLSSEAGVDGRQFALAYGAELQDIPGFEVVPVGVTERAMEAHHLELSSPRDVRRLAQLLGVDAVVIGAVTDYTPYYPPRCGLQIEWYAANPYFHPIPPGYGLPWGTPEEEEIPAPLVFDAEMALAREQLKTQTPHYELQAAGEAEDPDTERDPLPPLRPDADSSKSPEGDGSTGEGSPDDPERLQVEAIAHHSAASAAGAEHSAAGAEQGGQRTGPGGTIIPAGSEPPVDWPDPRGFFPPPPGEMVALQPTPEPVIRHTRNYNGADGDFTQSLTSYYFHRDDERCGGWQGYLQRSDDFIRFCCHRHIAEMLTARGGADESRVVWRWPSSR